MNRLAKIHKQKLSLETEVESSIKIMKFVAPRLITVNGYPSPCECTDTITCSYCVQASLLWFDKRSKADEEKVIVYIKKNGLRKTARDLNTQPSTIQYWLKSHNLPQWAVKRVYE
jgi:hypothetical protein